MSVVPSFIRHSAPMNLSRHQGAAFCRAMAAAMRRRALRLVRELGADPDRASALTGFASPIRWSFAAVVLDTVNSSPSPYETP
jgi:hypothetical protein